VTFVKRADEIEKKWNVPIIPLKLKEKRFTKDTNLVNLRLITVVLKKTAYQARLSNPGLIVLDDKFGNRLFVQDALNMYQDSCALRLW
jgi:hypothetical protein